MKAHLVIALASVLAAGACDKAEPADTPATAAAPTAPAGSAEAVARVLAMPVADRCGSTVPGQPTPSVSQIIDLGGGAFAILADCQAMPGEPTYKSLHVQGPDGMLKAQSLIVYNGPEHDDGFDWEVTQTSEATWDATARELVSVWTVEPNEEDLATKVSTVKWRWDGSKFVMVSAVRVTHATPGAPATGEVTGWPVAGETDPTPPATPV